MHTFRNVIIASTFLVPLVLAPAQASSQAEPSTPPSRADKLKQLQHVSTMGTVKDLGSFGADFQGDCPTLVSKQVLTTLLDAPVAKINRGGFDFSYYQKQNVRYGGKTFSANIKNDSTSSVMFALNGLKGEGAEIFGALARTEEIRDKDTDAVRAGASICKYQIFKAKDGAAYTDLIRHVFAEVQKKTYGDFTALHKDIVKQGGEAVELEGTLNIAVSQPGG